MRKSEAYLPVATAGIDLAEPAEVIAATLQCCHGYLREAAGFSWRGLGSTIRQSVSEPT